MRHLCVDTETTGLSADDGDRIIQIAVVEIVNLRLTGRTWVSFIDPEGRDIKFGSYQVHKITKEMLKGAPRFADVFGDLMAFIGDAQLVIQNKSFDLGMLRAEARRANKQFHHDAIDTIDLAKKKFPGSQVGLDALCRKLEIPKDAASLEKLCREINLDRQVTLEDRSKRHDALVDCLLLAQVFIAMQSATEFDLSQQGGSSRKPWPFSQHKLDLDPLTFDPSC